MFYYCGLLRAISFSNEESLKIESSVNECRLDKTSIMDHLCINEANRQLVQVKRIGFIQGLGEITFFL